MKAQGAEEAKLEPKGRMWGELMTRFFPWYGQNKNTERGNYRETIFACICIIGIQQMAGEGISSLQVPS